MPSFLLQYNRKAGKLIAEPEVYSSGEEAIRARVEAERLRANDDVEVVVVHGASIDSVKRTHSRYFMTNKQLLSATGKVSRGRTLARLRVRSA